MTSNAWGFLITGVIWALMIGGLVGGWIAGKSWRPLLDSANDRCDRERENSDRWFGRYMDEMKKNTEHIIAGCRILSTFSVPLDVVGTPDLDRPDADSHTGS